MKTIVVTKREGDVHVCLRDRPEIWACGRTLDLALGDLVRNHPEQFSVLLQRNENDPTTLRHFTETFGVQHP